MTRLANIVLSGSSARKTTGKQMRAIYRSTRSVLSAGRGTDHRPATRHGTNGRSRPPAHAGPGTGRLSRQHVDLPAEGYSPTNGQCSHVCEGPSAERSPMPMTTRWKPDKGAPFPLNSRPSALPVATEARVKTKTAPGRLLTKASLPS